MVSSTSAGGRSPLVLSGLVSGFDTGTMIQTLLAARRAEIGAAQTRISEREAQAKAVADVGTRLSGLLSQVQKFADIAFTQSKSAAITAGGTSANVAASVAPGATLGSFRVTVDQLADATRVRSTGAIGAAVDPNALLKDAQLGITNGSFTVNGVSITVDTATDTLNDVLQRIQTQVPGATATLVNDPSGRPNRISINHAGGVTLGAGADTSNFLSATKILASPSGASRESTGNLGTVKAGALLSASGLSLALNASTGKFKVNGVEITWDSSKDSLSSVLGKITNSTAGVNALYDAASDTVTLTQKATGSTAISLEDVSGNFLSAIGVAGATQTLGKNAKVQIDTGAGNVTYYSTTNTLTDTPPGVTLSLLKEGTVADTVAVSQDISGITGRVKDLVTGINGILDHVKKQTAYDAVGGNGPLAGDATITRLYAGIRGLVTTPIDGVTTGKRTLADIGITFGAVGAKPGTANTLTLDETKLRAALESDPAGVSNIFSAFRATATLDSGGTGGIEALSGDPTGLRKPGKYTITTSVNGDNTANITAEFKPADGGQTIRTALSNVPAGSVHTGLIPGLSVSLKALMTSGTDTVTISTPTRGIAAKLEQYLEPITRAGGLLDQRKDSSDLQIKSMRKGVDRMNERLTAERSRLQDSFARMEVALAKLKEQQSSLSALASMGF